MNLEGAVMKGCNLWKMDMKRVNMNKVCLLGATFGEFAPMKGHQGEVRCVASTHDLIASGDS